MKMLLVTTLLLCAQFSWSDCKTEKTVISDKVTEITLGGLNCEKAHKMLNKHLKKMKLNRSQILVKVVENSRCFTEGNKEYSCSWNPKWIETEEYTVERTYTLRTAEILCSQVVQERSYLTAYTEDKISPKFLTICQYKQKN